MRTPQQQSILEAHNALPDGCRYEPASEEALAAFEVEDPWERLSALVTPSPALAGKSVVEVLGSSRRKEEREKALAVLRDFLQ